MQSKNRQLFTVCMMSSNMLCYTLGLTPCYRGSATVTVFRSPAEFFFHAKWILLGCPKRDPRATPALDEELFGPPLPEEYTDRCGCTYCGGVSQTYISTHFSNYHPKKQVQGEAHKFHGKFEGIRKELYKKT